MKSPLRLLTLSLLGAGLLHAKPALAQVPYAHQTSVSGDILDQLSTIDGVTVTEGVAEDDSYRLFYLTFDQPADHHAPDAERFEQRLVLLHRDADAPLILHTQGYNVSSYPRPIPLANNLSANELRVEHRFFTPSRPASGNWDLLNIEQAAADLHRVSQAFHSVYTAPWISTGASKGGMTALYFRRFYPNDVDATLALVAPNSFGQRDRRYVPFLNSVGDAACRRRMRNYQKAVLSRRDDMVGLAEEWSELTGLTFDAMPHGASQALDYAVAETYFAFFQYAGVDFCEYVPLPSASDEELFEFLTILGTIDFTTDQVLEIFQPWFVQSTRQLGYPHLNTGHLRRLLEHDPNDYGPYTLGVDDGGFDWWAMVDMFYWVGFKAKNVMLIYGESDPWTAAAFQLFHKPARRDAYTYTVPGGNHGANVSLLVGDDKTDAIETLERWAGTSWTESAPLARGVIRSAPEWLPPVKTALSVAERRERIDALIRREQAALR